MMVDSDCMYKSEVTEPVPPPLFHVNLTLWSTRCTAKNSCKGQTVYSETSDVWNCQPNVTNYEVSVFEPFVWIWHCI